MERHIPSSSSPNLTRRAILQASAVTALASAAPAEQDHRPKSSATPAEDRVPLPLPDLRPAKWIWYPSGRTLPNTFVLLRRVVELPEKPRRAVGWISADSRYLLKVNGERMQWGPPPCDPRWLEADPVDLTERLKAGRNVLAATALYYGHGDGTWAMGKPGFLFWLEIELPDGSTQRIVSDATWQTFLARAWRPGQYKRWFLRALQEEFDARLYPEGWESPAFEPDDNWLPAMLFDAPPNDPPACSSYPEYAHEIGGDRRVSEMRRRSVPLVRETLYTELRLRRAMTLQWKRPAEEYFETVTPNAFEVSGPADVREDNGRFTFEAAPQHSVALTFELAEQVVGWPYFTIEAPEGTTIEMLVHEAHDPEKGPPLLNTHFHAWTRFICRAGVNRFEPFEYESCRWVQLVVRNASGRVTISDVGLRRRQFPWPSEPVVRVEDAALQRLMDATVNTLHNSCQETCVDGMGRERQQYSGDCGHQLLALYYTFGERQLAARFVNTYSQGLTLDGYFLDCWPGHDRLARLAQRQVQMTGWGPLLDHGVGFNFDCWNYYLHTGRLDNLREVFPRLLKFAAYLRSIVRDDGLLPVENIGVPSVWIDHQGFRQQRHKHCVFNLYAAAMLQHALAPLCRAHGEDAISRQWTELGRRLQAACVQRYWSDEHEAFVDNLPWIAEEKGGPRYHDRTLATAVLFDQCPGGRKTRSIELLATMPKEVGLSFPANSGWRLWALGEGGRSDVIVRDLRQRWATLPSVILNNTLQEDWEVRPDSGSQWSHSPAAPLYVLYMTLVGDPAGRAGVCAIHDPTAAGRDAAT
jgi:alpha-L-rhamnosidase